MMNIQKLLLLSVIVLSAVFSLAEPLVYIPLGSGNTVIEVDAATDTITRDFGEVSNPHGLAATSDGEYLFAGNLDQDESYTVDGVDYNSSLALVHVFHGHVMHELPINGWSHHQAMTPDDKFVLSTHPMEQTVSVMDVSTFRVVAEIKTDPGPYYVAITKDGQTALVSNSTAGTIQEFSVGDWSLEKTYKAGPAPEHMVLSKDERLLYVNNARSGEIRFIERTSGEVIKTVEAGSNLHGIDISDDGTKLFVSSRNTDELFAISTLDGSITQATLSPAPYHLNTITGTGKVYVSSRSKPLIWVINQKDLSLIGTIDLPAGEAHQMAIVYP